MLLDLSEDVPPVGARSTRLCAAVQTMASCGPGSMRCTVRRAVAVATLHAAPCGVAHCVHRLLMHKFLPRGIIWLCQQLLQQQARVLNLCLACVAVRCNLPQALQCCRGNVGSGLAHIPQDPSTQPAPV